MVEGAENLTARMLEGLVGTASERRNVQFIGYRSERTKQVSFTLDVLHLDCFHGCDPGAGVVTFQDFVHCSESSTSNEFAPNELDGAGGIFLQELLDLILHLSVGELDSSEAHR